RVRSQAADVEGVIMKRLWVFAFLLVLATASSRRVVVLRASNGVSNAFGTLAPAFVANPDEGSDAKFVSVGGGHPIFFTGHDVRMVDRAARRSIWLSFVGSGDAIIDGERPSGGRVTYFRGGRSVVRTAYRDVLYRGVWKGVDARISGRPEGIEYAFELAPG